MGYFHGGQIKELLDAGIDVVVPDKAAAREMRGLKTAPDAIEFEKVEGQNAYRCPEGNILKAYDYKERGGQKFFGTSLLTIAENVRWPRSV